MVHIIGLLVGMWRLIPCHAGRGVHYDPISRPKRPDMKDIRHGLLVKIGSRPPMRCRFGVPLHGLPATTTTVHVPSTGCYGLCAVSCLAADMSPALERVGG
jgi:hypothetical protein